MIEVLIQVVGAIVFVLVMRWLGNTFPAHLPGEDDGPIEQPGLSVTLVVLVLIGFFVALITGTLAAGLFAYFSWLGAPPPGGASLAAGWVFAFLPSFFAGILLTHWPFRLAMSTIYGEERFAALERGSNQAQGVDDRRAVVWLTKVLAPPLLLLALAFANFGLVVREAGLEHRPFLGLPRLHAYEDVQAVARIREFTAPNGKRIDDKPFLVIVLRDGTTISSRWLPERALPGGLQVEDVFVQAAERAGLELQEVRELEDVLPPK